MSSVTVWPRNEVAKCERPALILRLSESFEHLLLALRNLFRTLSSGPVETVALDDHLFGRLWHGRASRGVLVEKRLHRLISGVQPCKVLRCCLDHALHPSSGRSSLRAVAASSPSEYDVRFGDSFRGGLAFALERRGLLLQAPRKKACGWGWCRTVVRYTRHRGNW